MISKSAFLLLHKREYEAKTNTMSVLVENVSVNSEITVEISGEKLITDNVSATDRIYDIILHSQIDYATKTRLWYSFKDKSQFLYTPCSQKEYSELLSAVGEMRNLLF